MSPRPAHHCGRRAELAGPDCALPCVDPRDDWPTWCSAVPIHDVGRADDADVACRCLGADGALAARTHRAPDQHRRARVRRVEETDPRRDFEPRGRPREAAERGAAGAAAPRDPICPERKVAAPRSPPRLLAMAHDRRVVAGAHPPVFAGDGAAAPGRRVARLAAHPGADPMVVAGPRIRCTSRYDQAATGRKGPRPRLNRAAYQDRRRSDTCRPRLDADHADRRRLAQHAQCGAVAVGAPAPRRAPARAAACSAG